MDQQYFEHLQKCAEQRAFLMGMIRTILDETDIEVYGERTRQMCLATLAMMIDFKSMVRDEIDRDVIKKAKLVCEQDLLLDEINDILNQND